MEHERIIDKSSKSTQPAWSPLKSSGENVEAEEHSGLDILNHLLEDSMENAQNEQQPKREPKNLFDSKDEYLAFRAKWSQLANEKKLTSTMIMFYNVVRGKEIGNGFTSIINVVKLANGQQPDKGLTTALASVKYIAMPKNEYAERERASFIALFDKTINDEFMSKVANYLPQQ